MAELHIANTIKLIQDEYSCQMKYKAFVIVSRALHLMKTESDPDSLDQQGGCTSTIQSLLKMLLVGFTICLIRTLSCRSVFIQRLKKQEC